MLSMGRRRLLQVGFACACLALGTTLFLIVSGDRRTFYWVLLAGSLANLLTFALVFRGTRT